MKPGTRSLFTVCASAMLVALLAACPNPIVPGKGGVLTISINNNIDERTLLPPIDMDADSFSVIGTGPGGADFSQTTTGAPVTVSGLAFGSWSVTVNALECRGHHHRQRSGNSGRAYRADHDSNYLRGASGGKRHTGPHRDLDRFAGG